jgi:hypothetical protein
MTTIIDYLTEPHVDSFITEYVRVARHAIDHAPRDVMRQLVWAAEAGDFPPVRILRSACAWVLGNLACYTDDDHAVRLSANRLLAAIHAADDELSRRRHINERSFPNS